MRGEGGGTLAESSSPEARSRASPASTDGDSAVGNCVAKCRHQCAVIVSPLASSRDATLDLEDIVFRCLHAAWTRSPPSLDGADCMENWIRDPSFSIILMSSVTVHVTFGHMDDCFQMIRVKSLRALLQSIRSLAFPRTRSGKVQRSQARLTAH